MYKIKSAQLKQAEDAGFDLEGNYMGGEVGGGGFGGGEGGGFEFEPGGGGEGEEFDLGPPMEEELPATEIEAPPATPELGPPAGEGEGAGADLLAPRFKVRTPQNHLRTGEYQDLEQVLDILPIWDRGDQVFGVPKRRVAYLLDKIAHTNPRKRDGRVLVPALHKEGLTQTQAELVQYCGTRLGLIAYPQINGETIERLQKLLTDKADEHGLNQQISDEFNHLARVVGRRIGASPQTQMGRKLSHESRLSNAQILTGVV